MIRIYNYMAMGVALTGIVSWLTFNAAVTEAAGKLALTPFGQTLYSGPVTIVLLPGHAGTGLRHQLDDRETLTGHRADAVHAVRGPARPDAVVDLLVYTGTSITRVFFISAAAFGALSLWGYTTQRDLSAMGTFLIMGLFGLIIAMLVNIFLKSSGLDFVISAAGVLIFAGLTAWDTQKIKEMYDPMEDGTAAGRKAVMGALTLYLDFINLFLFLLRFMGDRR